MLKKCYFSFFFLLSLFTVFLFSKDSFLYDATGHYDSAWFWYCGKWMMEGLVPYQEYADSKGPLFFLIYGLAYLLTPTSHLGVCFFSIISYGFAYYISFRTFQLYVSDKKALIGSLLMVIFYWNPLFVSETRAEHFTFPLFALCLFTLLQSISNPLAISSFRNGFILGVGILSAFLIKWSISAMFWGFGFSFLYLSIKNKKIIQFIVGTLLGSVIIALPFVIYFNHVSSIKSFIDEYVCNVASTVSRPFAETLWMYVKEWVKLFVSRRVVYVLFILSGINFLRNNGCTAPNKGLGLVFLSALGILSIGIHQDDFMMYLTPMAPFGIFMILCGMTSSCVQAVNSRIIQSCLALLLLMHMVWVVDFAQGTNLFCRNHDYRKEFFDASFYIGQIDKPYILNLGNETGVGSSVSDVQPACKYWSFQRFSTEEMMQQQRLCLHSKKPDFVTLQFWTQFITKEEIEASGYHYIAHFGYTDLFTKHDLKKVPEDMKISDYDVLFQRNLREIMYGVKKDN